MSSITPSNSPVPHPEYKEQRVAREGGSLYVRDYAGEGPAFVMMHGFPDNLHIYDDLVPHLVAAGRRVVTFDFLGFGQSDKPDGAKYSFRQQLEDLVEVVKALGLQKIVPVAHDSSGPAAVNFALEFPSQVSSVVVLNALYDHSDTVKYPEFIELFATQSIGALTQAFLKSPEQFAFILNFQRAEFQRHLSDKHKDYYAKFLGPIIDENFRQRPSSAPAFARMTFQLFDEVGRNTKLAPRLKEIHAPVHLIWGGRDPYLNVGFAEHLKSHFSKGSLDVLDAGHWLQIDIPEEVAALMLKH